MYGQVIIILHMFRVYARRLRLTFTPVIAACSALRNTASAALRRLLTQRLSADGQYRHLGVVITRHYTAV